MIRLAQVSGRQDSAGELEMDDRARTIDRAPETSQVHVDAVAGPV
jgi:hypothetical protein